MSRAGFVIGAALSGFILIACTADMDGSPLQGNKKKSGSSGQGNEECSNAALTPTDPETLPKCACAKGGAARCVPKDIVPGAVASSLEACSEGGPGVCVPDKLVQSGGAAPKTCNAGSFGEGRCMSLCVPEIAKNAGLLQRGDGNVCDEDERCAPCLNPLKNKEPTGVCEIGKPAPASCEANKDDKPGGGGGTQPTQCPYEGPPVVDVNTFPACGSGARCVPENLVPPSSASQLKKCATGLCAPEKSIAAGGQYRPKTCKSVAGAEGRCLNENIPAVESQKATLPQDTCDPAERCTPCFSPLDGKETGACKTVSCDAPKQPATTFKGCCEKDGELKGKCVPTAMVPASSQDKLESEGCVEGQELCAPNENLDPNHKAATCKASTFFTGDYEGVCVSDCIKFSFFEGLGTSQGDCANNTTCVPCVRNGEPTGAPGCPNTPAN